ncbi:MAG: hypothetical protein ACRD3C_10790 [Vicinamibacterales bacterium]
MSRESLQSERLFYVIAAYLMLAATLIGFREFYLRGRGFGGPMNSDIMPLIVTHGFVMSAWIALFCVQSTLILRGNRQRHMVIGPLGAVLAVLVVVLGSSVALFSVRFNPKIYEPLGGPQFSLMLMLSEMVLFGTLVTVGIVNRRRAEIHRPMMLLGTIVIVSGSLFRLPYVLPLGILPPLYFYNPALLFGALLFLLHWGMTRTMNRPYLIATPRS